MRVYFYLTTPESVTRWLEARSPEERFRACSVFPQPVSQVLDWLLVGEGEISISWEKTATITGLAFEQINRRLEKTHANRLSITQARAIAEDFSEGEA